MKEHTAEHRAQLRKAFQQEGTWSKSTRSSLPTPDLKSIEAAWLPTPPSPITTTYDWVTFSWDSRPKNWMFLTRTQKNRTLASDHYFKSQIWIALALKGASYFPVVKTIMQKTKRKSTETARVWKGKRKSFKRITTARMQCLTNHKEELRGGSNKSPT